MYSKNNNDRHPLRREYFDSPVNYVHRGFIFSPKHKLPLEFYDNGKSHYNIRKQKNHNKSAIRRNFTQTMTRIGDIIPRITSIRGLAADNMTMGMPDDLLYLDVPNQNPKTLAQKGGQISNDYGKIPGLRESDTTFNSGSMWNNRLGRRALGKARRKVGVSLDA